MEKQNNRSRCSVFTAQKDQIKQAFTSKQNSEHENQVILQKITDDKKWHYTAVKKPTRITKRNNVKK